MGDETVHWAYSIYDNYNKIGGECGYLTLSEQIFGDVMRWSL